MSIVIEWPLEGSVYREAQKRDMGPAPSYSFTMHGRGKRLTELILEKVRPHVKRVWKTDETPHILEVGAGSGNLATVITQETGALVWEVDLFEGEHQSSYRRIADMTRMPFESASIDVVVSSFAVEYEGLPAYREIARVLRGGGHLVALVHHMGSALYPSNFIQRGMAAFIVGGYRLVSGIRPIGAITPNFILEPWRDMAHQAVHLKRAAYPDQFALISHLTQAGFGDISIETAMSPPLFMSSATTMLDTGWLVTAVKK